MDFISVSLFTYYIDYMYMDWPHASRAPSRPHYMCMEVAIFKIAKNVCIADSICTTHLHTYVTHSYILRC